MKAKTDLMQQKVMTEEETILNDPEWKAAIEEFDEAKRKGIKPWKLPQP